MHASYFFLTFFLSLLFTPVVRTIMRHFDIVDKPKTQKRKIHKKNIPLGGGLAIFLSLFAVVFVAFLYGSIGNDILPKNLFGLFVAGSVLMVGGLIDDAYTIRARYQIVFPVAAALMLIAFGIGLDTVTNPFGEAFRLDMWKLPVDGLGNWVVLADIIVFFWLMAMMFTTKFLDGLDGLVAGVVAIGALMIYFLSMQTQWYQPEVALLAAIFAGACFGFLVWNWHPARIFLGEGGSLFTGFMLGSLAIISGGKIATTLLVMGLPMLDVARVILLRIQKKKPVYIGDSEHLHFKLLSSGLSQKQAVLLFYSISFLFGVTTLFLQSKEKLIALLFLLILMLLIGVWFGRNETNQVY
jgi:UDP-GlcNAc:undecaprenyl-phosphate GlcNAc-1-phosphate transferase